MKLRYISTPTDLGGAAVPGCGTIHKSEITETLDKLTDDLFLSFDLIDYTLGSTGKREYSGDIDLVIDNAWWPHGIGAFRENLDEVFGKDNVSRHGDMLHLKYPIVNYKPEYNEALPRTGFVQIDFNFGDVGWEKLYHYSAGEKSEYKGGHRNLLIAAICSSVNVEIGPNPYPEDAFCLWVQDRPISTIRWKFGPHGLFRVNRVSQKDRNGVWMRKQKDIDLEGPYKTAWDIRRILFPYSSYKDDLNSFETLMAAVKRNYGMTDQERVWKQAAFNFYDWPQGRLFEYPEEIAKYLPPSDK